MIFSNCEVFAIYFMSCVGQRKKDILWGHSKAELDTLWILGKAKPEMLQWGQSQSKKFSASVPSVCSVRNAWPKWVIRGHSTTDAKAPHCWEGLLECNWGKKACTLDSLQHSSPQEKNMRADFPELLSVLQNFLVLLKMWSSPDLHFYSIFTLLPDEFCTVWTWDTLLFHETVQSQDWLLVP